MEPRKEVTGRDEYIIGQALAVAIPFLLLYSPSVSNTRDLMAIFKEKYHPGALDGISEKALADVILSYLQKLWDGCCLQGTVNEGRQQALAEAYFEDLESFMPKITIADRWREANDQSRKTLVE